MREALKLMAYEIATTERHFTSSGFSSIVTRLEPHSSCRAVDIVRQLLAYAHLDREAIVREGIAQSPAWRRRMRFMLDELSDDIFRPQAREPRRHSPRLRADAPKR